MTSGKLIQPYDLYHEGKIWKESGDFVYYLLRVFVVLLMVFFVLGRHAVVDGQSMEPTFLNADRVIVSRFLYEPQRGDVIAFYETTSLDKPLVKRVIAVAGDTVDISADGHVILNGIIQQEDYIADLIWTSRRGNQPYPVTVPEGCVLAMGDNRNNSHDSRWTDIGFVDTDTIIGKVLVRFYPLDRLGVSF